MDKQILLAYTISNQNVKRYTHPIQTNFGAVDMSKPGYYHVTYGTSNNGKTVEATFTVVAMADRTTIANGGFENGNVAGWAHTVGLARRIWLSDDGSDLRIAPVEALNSLHGEVQIRSIYLARMKPIF